MLTNAPSAISFSGGIYTLSQNLTIAPTDHLLINSDAIIHMNADVQITVLETLLVTQMPLKLQQQILQQLITV